jgi:hypothetical protein
LCTEPFPKDGGPCANSKAQLWSVFSNFSKPHHQSNTLRISFHLNLNSSLHSSALVARSYQTFPDSSHHSFTSPLPQISLASLVLLTMAPEIGSVPNIESKSAKKKRGKIDAAAISSTGTATPAADASSQAEPAPNGVDGARDSPYLKELNK